MTVAEPWLVSSLAAVKRAEGNNGFRSEQGKVLGLRALLQTAMAVFGPLVFSEIYTSTVKWQPPFAFWMLSACTGVGLLTTFVLRGDNFT